MKEPYGHIVGFEGVRLKAAFGLVYVQHFGYF